MPIKSSISLYITLTLFSVYSNNFTLFPVFFYIQPSLYSQLFPVIPSYSQLFPVIPSIFQIRQDLYEPCCLSVCMYVCLLGVRGCWLDSNQRRIYTVSSRLLWLAIWCQVLQRVPLNWGDTLCSKCFSHLLCLSGEVKLRDTKTCKPSMLSRYLSSDCLWSLYPRYERVYTVLCKL